MLRRMIPASLLDVFWPRSCEICGHAAGETARYLCWDCLSTLPVIEMPFCSVCGDPVDGAITRDYVCSLCVDRKPAYDHARSAVRFRGGIKDLLHRFKYSQASYLDRDLAVLLHACVRTHFSGECFDAIVGVPLHHAKERARTYNQAALLAGHLASLMDVPLARGCVKRVRATGTQTRLNMRQRAQNMEGAFETPFPEWIEGRRFLVVDDVMTTGATLSAVSAILKDAGAARVCAVTVARG